MRAKKIFAVATTVALALTMNLSVFANEGSKWSYTGPKTEEEKYFNELKWFENDANNYTYNVWSKEGTSEKMGISQKVKITEPGKYTLTMDIMGGSGDGITVVPFIGDNKGAGTATTGWNDNPSTWANIKFTANLKAGVYDVGCLCDMSNQNAWGYIDNISLVDENGDEVLNKGDFEIAQDEWEDYIGDDASFEEDSEPETDAEEEETEDAGSDDVDEPSDPVTSEDGNTGNVAETGDMGPVAMGSLIILAAGVIIFTRKRSEA